MKRGYDSYRGGHHGPLPPGFKKYRRDDVDPVNPTPSKVLHIRNLTQDTTEADLLAALSHFGNVAYTTLMSNGHMALAEFVTMDQARACIAYSKNHQITVRGHPVLINYSTSEKIQRGGLESEDPSRVIVLTITNVTYSITVDILKEICSEHGKVNRVALIKRSGLLQALVEFDNVEEATKAKYGLNGADIYDNACTLKVEFGRMNVVKVTANNADQWDYTGDPALNPKPSLDKGSPRGEGYDAHRADDASWRRDFPRRHEPDPSFTQPNSYGSGGGYVPPSNYDSNGAGYRGARGAASSASYREQKQSMSRLSHAKVTLGGRPRGGGTYIPESRTPPLGAPEDREPYGAYNVSRGRGPAPPPRGAPPSAWPEHDARASRYDDADHGYEYDRERDRAERPRGGGGSWRGSGIDPRGPPERGYGRDDRYDEYADHDRRPLDDRHRPLEGAYNEGPPRGPPMGINGAVVMVYGINPTCFTCDRLFNILCCYGNCLKIKYMHTKPDTCMVQMGSSDEAASVIEHLQDIEVFNTKLTFRPSKQNIVHDVREPHLLYDQSPAFRDYSNSSVHRFSTPQQAALNKVVYPTSELFWFNAPPIMSEEVMKKLFTQKNAPVPTHVNLIESSTSSSGILRFASAYDATEALMICNNMVIAGGAGSMPYVFKLAYASQDQRA